MLGAKLASRKYIKTQLPSFHPVIALTARRAHVPKDVAFTANWRQREARLSPNVLVYTTTAQMLKHIVNICIGRGIR